MGSRKLSIKAFVDIFSMGRPYNKHEQFFLGDGVYYSVIAGRYAIKFLVALQFFADLRTRIFRQASYLVDNLTLHAFILFADKFLSLLGYTDFIHPCLYPQFPSQFIQADKLALLHRSLGCLNVSLVLQRFEHIYILNGNNSKSGLVVLAYTYPLPAEHHLVGDIGENMSRICHTYTGHIVYSFPPVLSQTSGAISIKSYKNLKNYKDL